MLPGKTKTATPAFLEGSKANKNQTKSSTADEPERMINKRNEGVTTLKGLNTPSTSPEVERGIGGRTVIRV